MTSLNYFLELSETLTLLAKFGKKLIDRVEFFERVGVIPQKLVCSKTEKENFNKTNLLMKIDNDHT